MSVYDQIAQAAANKSKYVNTAGMARPQVAPKPRFQPKPTVNPAPTGPGISGSAGKPASGLLTLQQLRENAATAEAAKSDGGFNPLNAIGRGVAGGFGAVLDVADFSRRAYQGVAGEIGDVVSNVPGVVRPLANVLAGNPFQLRGLKDNETGERDQGFDFGEIRERVTGDDAISQGFLGMTDWDDNLPGFVRPVVGFAGDILTDPLTYLTAGTVGVGSKVAGQAGRVALAQSVAKAATTDIGKKVSTEVTEKLIREAGTRGAGAFTKRGLKRSGASVEDLANLGLKPDWGLSVGVGKRQAKIGGTARPAQAIADVKGSVKRFTGQTGVGRLSRELFTTAEYGESKLKQQILSGGADAPTAARAMAVLGRAKGDSWLWFDDATRRLQAAAGDDGKKLVGMSADDAKALTHALEAGNFNHPLVQSMTDIFEKFGQELQAKGVGFNTRQGYVPHRLSKKAIRNLNAGDTEIKMLIDDTIDKPEMFQKLRQSDKSIAEVNADWRKTHDYDLLETDFRVLAAQYLGEGQEAVMKANLTGKLAEDAGLVTAMGKTIDGDAVRKSLDAEAAKEAELIAKSVNSRRTAIKKATQVARRNVAETSQKVTQAKQKLTKAQNRVGTLKARAVKLEANMQSARVALSQQEAIAKTVRGQEKAAVTRKIEQLHRQLDSSAAELQSAQRQLANAENNFGKWTDDVRQAEEQYAIYEKNFSDLMDDRAALDNAPVAKSAVQAQEAADKAAVKAQAANEKFANAQTEVAAAETTAQFIQSDVTQVVDRLTAEIAEFDDWVGRVKATRKAGKPTMDSNMALRDEQRELLSDIRDVLRTSDDPQVQQIAKLEAQAIIADTKALMGTSKGKAPLMGRMARKRMQAEFDAGINLLGNPRFQEYVVDQLDEGMTRLKRQLGDDAQINEAYRAAIETHRQFIDPATRGPAFRALQDGMRSMGKAMNWWKGWALASPGFVMRNVYSGMFAQFLDDAFDPRISGRFYRYLKKAEADPAAARLWAVGKYGDEAANQLEEAHRVAAASGWGMSKQEVEGSLSAGKTWINPGSKNFAPVWGIRKMASESEAYLRGGHAYNVLNGGGSFEDALSRVEKFHFNYRDISDFDRNAKKVMPFYTFWSRNMALQATVFAKKPQKITRSFYNAKRNIEESAEPDTGELPWYFQNDMAGILTPFGSAEGRGRMYATPDIPSARFPSQMANMADDPLSDIVQQLAPPFKTPIQLATNKNFFQDRPYRNSLTTYGDDGEVPRYAPGLFQTPGVRDVLGMLPGAEVMDDKLLMQDNVEAALMDVNPLLSRAGRLPGVQKTERQEETNRQFWLNFFGGSVRWNDPGSQMGAAAARTRQADEIADKVWERIRLEKLVAEGGA